MRAFGQLRELLEMIKFSHSLFALPFALTGMVVAGTAQNPVIYVASGDPRIGGGSNGNDKNLDTNSGIIARLTWNGSSWQKLDLVRGLPRSEGSH